VHLLAFSSANTRLHHLFGVGFHLIPIINILAPQLIYLGFIVASMVRAAVLRLELVRKIVKLYGGEMSVKELAEALSAIVSILLSIMEFISFQGLRTKGVYQFLLGEGDVFFVVPFSATSNGQFQVSLRDDLVVSTSPRRRRRYRKMVSLLDSLLCLTAFRVMRELLQ